MYQLKPVGRAKLWWSIMGIAAVLLLLPLGVNAVVPDNSKSYRQLSIGAVGYEWEVPVVTGSGAPVMCEMTSDDLFMKYWECNGDTTVVTMLVEGVEDPENTLRRMIRATLATPMPEDIVPTAASEDGRAHALLQPGTDEGFLVSLPIVAISQQGQGDYEDVTAVAIVNGVSNEYYASHIWSSLAVDRGLPYEQEFPLQLSKDEPEYPMEPDPFGGLSPEDLPWDQFPWEEWLNEPEGATPPGGIGGFGSLPEGLLPDSEPADDDLPDAIRAGSNPNQSPAVEEAA